MRKNTLNPIPCTPHLSVNIAGIKLDNPVMCASGTFNFAEEYSEIIDIKKLGAIVTKTITLEPRQGNPPSRVCETASGMLNCIGLQNPGVEEFIKTKLPFLRKCKVPVIVSIAGETTEEYCRLVQILSKEKGISAFEVNISCPNVRSKIRNMMFSQDSKATFEVVHQIKKFSKIPVIVKLSPNVTSISVIAIAAEMAGADALALINTPIGMAVDAKKKTPILSMITGGLSGPCIKPIALRMVWETFNCVKIPIIGIGGIMDWKDAIEFILCGAKAVEVGTANFVDPNVMPNIVEGIKNYMHENKIKDLKEIVGKLKINK